MAEVRLVFLSEHMGLVIGKPDLQNQRAASTIQEELVSPEDEGLLSLKWGVQHRQIV